mgnify:FL=1
MERRTVLALFPVIQQDGSKNLTEEKDLVIMKQVQSESIRYRQKENRDVTNLRYIPVFYFSKKGITKCYTATMPDNRRNRARERLPPNAQRYSG